MLPNNANEVCRKVEKSCLSTERSAPQGHIRMFLAGYHCARVSRFHRYLPEILSQTATTLNGLQVGRPNAEAGPNSLILLHTPWHSVNVT